MNATDLLQTAENVFGDDLWTYLTTAFYVCLGAGFVFVVYALVKAAMCLVYFRWQEFKPAFKLALLKLGEKREMERNRAEEVKLLFCDGITDLADELLLAGKITKKERRKYWTMLGRAMELPDLLVRKVKHPKAIINDINRRHIDTTPVPLPDLKFSPAAKFSNWKTRKVA